MRRTEAPPGTSQRPYRSVGQACAALEVTSAVLGKAPSSYWPVLDRLQQRVYASVHSEQNRQRARHTPLPPCSSGPLFQQGAYALHHGLPVALKLLKKRLRHMRIDGRSIYRYLALI